MEKTQLIFSFFLSMKIMTTAMIQVIRLFRLLLSRKNKNTQKRKYTKKDFRFPREKHESANFFWSENDKEIFHEKRKTRKSNWRGKRNTRRNKFMNFRKIKLFFMNFTGEMFFVLKLQQLKLLFIHVITIVYLIKSNWNFAQFFKCN